ncbi:alpha-N-acetylglucosaminidase C-terminal domain-containing protein [Microbacterium sp. KUDC0406]|uniref:alpha-N-acetylglucosaminidase C-terminal domain-containing protein n=1 Tax=Microbacterium sp. KUDC0406 TaxID=2909588 RepID=UPI0022A767F0|nr:alpha-N-acetylglucosaminidase C-terminal domain-containing protein [Microbacterium sp. KUDC0406]
MGPPDQRPARLLGRHWSGLIRDLYLPRWAAWTEWLAAAVERGDEPDEDALRRTIVQIEEAWRDARGSDDASDQDPLESAARALDRLGM